MMAGKDKRDSDNQDEKGAQDSCDHTEFRESVHLDRDITVQRADPAPRGPPERSSSDDK